MARGSLKSLCAVCCVLCADCWLLVADAWACPGCKEALFDPAGLPQRLSMAKGYALSIALLLGLPVVLLATVTGIIIVHAARRKPGRADGRRQEGGGIDTVGASR